MASGITHSPSFQLPAITAAHAPLWHVVAAVRYYAAFPTEIDDLLQRQATIAEREQAAAKRERTILA